MNNDEWKKKAREIIRFMKKHQRRPSKYYAEDAAMHNWFKYNKRAYNHGTMPNDRKRVFKRVLTIAEKYRRVNQNAYVHMPEEADLFK